MTNSTTMDPNSAGSGIPGPMELDQLANGSAIDDVTSYAGEVGNAGGEPANDIAAPTLELDDAPAAPAKRTSKRTSKGKG